MTTTIDLEDMRARLLSQELSHDARLDVLSLLEFVRDARMHSTRHYHDLEEIADAMAEDGQPTWANTLLDAATSMYDDLYPQHSHVEVIRSLLPPIRRDRRGVIIMTQRQNRPGQRYPLTAAELALSDTVVDELERREAKGA